MRLVAGGALAVLDRLMFDLACGKLLFHVFMALEAQFAVRLEQQPFLRSRVRVMAGQTFAVLDWQVFAFAFGHRRVVAIQAERLARLEEQLLVEGFMRFMAGSAFPVVRRLMDDLHFRQKIRSEEHTSELQSHSFISYAVFCLKK